MRYQLVLALMTFTLYGFAQTRLPMIKASSNQAKIYEQFGAVSNWGINPEINLDVHSTGKLSRSIRVKFKTDVDSISFKLAPGQHKDFIVLLNGKDSCLTRIESPKPKVLGQLTVAVHDTIPFLINTYNTNYLSVVLNGKDSLLLNFDTGATEVCIVTENLKQKVKSQLQLYCKAYDIKIGTQTYSSMVYDIAVAGQETDGLLGWNLFDGMIVELDYDHRCMIIHSKMPKQIVRDTGYEKFKLTFIKNKPFIESEIQQSGIKSKSLFFFDLGYQRAVMLDNDALSASRFPTDKMPVIKKVVMHGTKGNEVPVITAVLEGLKIGKLTLTNVPRKS
jgi:hypothetical protein